MPYDVEMPESIDTGGGFLQEPGTYHLAVLNVNEQPQSKGCEMIDGFQVDLEVIAGPHAKKQKEITLWNPKLTDKNGGEMAKKKQARFCLAACILPEAKPGQKVTVDLQLAKGRQLVATLSQRDGSDGKKYLDLNFADIWHVDDPAAPQCERNQDALKLLPKSLRRDPKSFQQNGGAVKPAAGVQQQSQQPLQQSSQQQQTAPVSQGVNLDDV